MTGIGKLLFYSIVRFGGAMQIPLFALFLLGAFGIPSYWHRKKALLWCGATIIGTFVWRIMWIGSSNGRSTRYYVFTAVVAIFLLPLGIHGAIRVGKWLRLDRLPLKPAHWWTVLTITVIALNLSFALCPTRHKTFLTSVSSDIAGFRQAQTGPVVFLDATKERGRIQFPADVTVIEVIKLRYKEQPESFGFFCKQFEAMKLQDSAVLLFLRQPEDRSTEAVLKEKFLLKKISEYPFRSNLYTLYQISLQNKTSQTASGVSHEKNAK